MFYEHFRNDRENGFSANTAFGMPREKQQGSALVKCGFGERGPEAYRAPPSFSYQSLLGSSFFFVILKLKLLTIFLKISKKFGFFVPPRIRACTSSVFPKREDILGLDRFFLCGWRVSDR